MRRTGKEGLHTRVKQTKEVKDREVIEEQMEATKAEVYTLSVVHDYEGSYVIGIYSSEQEAEQAKESYVAYKDMKYSYEGRLVIESALVDFRYWETVDVAGKLTRPSARVR